MKCQLSNISSDEESKRIQYNAIMHYINLLWHKIFISVHHSKLCLIHSSFIQHIKRVKNNKTPLRSLRKGKFS